MNLEIIFNHLEAKGLGAEGSDLFLHNMPPHVETGILIKENLNGTMINHELPGYYRTSFKVIARSSNYTAASDLMNEVSRALSFKDKTLEGTYFQFVRPMTRPLSYRVSDSNNFEVAVQFEVACVE